MMGMLPSADTFINSGNPDNNNGASASLCVGVDDSGGIMRGLVRFDMPASLAGATVSSVNLTLTMRATVNGMAGGAFALLRLHAINESWTEGNAVGDAQMMFPVGQTCGDTVSGATWNQPSCALGTATPWATAGASVATTPSGQLDSNNVGIDVPVQWSSSQFGNGGLLTDVQRWIDDPSSNHGWRLSAADEATVRAAQRFYSKEGDATKGPKLTVTYDMPAR